jgi:predicted ATPase
MRRALARADSALKSAIEAHGGSLFKKTGDGICAAFPEAGKAVGAALEAQKEIVSWSSDSLPIRMAVYTGPAQESEGDYVGPTLNRTARMLSVAHGRQIILSQATRELVLGALPAGASLLDLGEHQLKDLERPERIFQLNHAGIPSDFPPLNSLAAFRHNLPIHLTSLIGREEQSRIVADLLAGHRLVTLYGSGGCGKTRLALQVGADVLETFPDGVWLVELSNAVDSVQAEQAMAAALGLREESGVDTGQAIVGYLRDRTALMILDNCEHLVEACARQGQALLNVCPKVKVLATSREVLDITGEVKYRVPSLQTPPLTAGITENRLSEITSADSVRLFLERASEALPGFALTTRNAPAIATNTRRLDGIPLALELAAARVKTMTAEEISDRIRDHFSIVGRPRGGSARHGTLRATLDWSYQLLDERERALLARLTIFAGSWTLAAAEFICAAGIPGGGSPFESEEVIDLLARLEDKSLIIAERMGDSSRYRMLQMVREYGAEKLTESEAEAVGARHLEYFMGLAVEAEANISGPDQGDWLKRLDIEHDNLRSALDHAKRHAERSESGLLQAGSLARYWHIRGILSEGRRQLQSIISLAEGKARTRGAGLAFNGAGILAWSQGDFGAARSYYESAYGIWEELKDEFRLAATMSNLGLLLVETEDFPSAKVQLDASLAIRRSIGDQEGTARSLNNLALWAARQKDFATSLTYNEASLALRREMGDENGIATSLANLGVVASEARNFQNARNYYAESLGIFERMGDKAGRAYVMLNLGDLTREQGKDDEAAEWFRKSLIEFQCIGDSRGVRMASEKFTTSGSSQIPDCGPPAGVIPGSNEAD